MYVPVPRLCNKYTRTEQACLCSSGYALKCIVPRLFENYKDVNEHVYIVPGTYWNTRYPDVRNTHVVNGRGHWLYASGYPLKCIVPLFPIGTRHLHSRLKKYCVAA